MELYKENMVEERYALAMERIGQMQQERTVPAPFDSYFRKTAQFLQMLHAQRQSLKDGSAKEWTLQQWQEQNHTLYQDILPQRYGESWGNPAYACKMLGEDYGRLLSFLYTELRGLIGYVFEEQAVPELLETITVHLELFIEIYNCFELAAEGLPSYKEIRQIVYWFVSDYSDIFVTERIRQGVDPARSFAVDIIQEADLSDLRYLYRFGEYVTENELQMASFLNTLDEAQIRALADTYTEGYRRGFVQAGKDLSKKFTVEIRYRLGLERVVREAIRNFAKMGLRPLIFRYALSSVNKRGCLRLGYSGAVPNPQFDYDHREDAALYLDSKFVERRLGVMRSAYETFKTLAAGYAGPAVMELFGEEPFAPRQIPEVISLSEKQQKLLVKMNSEASRITNRYIDPNERSFTIIDFPEPAIGPQFEEIFRETVKINTLDNDQWRAIQQTMIDALDQGNRVRILGSGNNRTDLTVALHPLKDPAKETIFENCVADVNIPVGEVFTSPRLEGTNGVLHVSRVFLMGLEYKNLCLTFRDGRVTDYSCTNFDTEEENRSFIHANLLAHHDTLPLGEFAIGTNTTAYAMAKKYDIGHKLPILIAEKMGPHFAVGDTCYSWEEDNPVYNPDGKEIIARDNEISLLRREDPPKAYFGCHTDITLPYEELGLLEAEGENGYRRTIIRDGKFVLEGTEALNEAL